MKSLSEPLQGKEHKCDSEEAKRLHMSASSLQVEKNTFNAEGFEPGVSHIEASDLTTRLNCSHNLNISYSSEYIYTITGKGQLQVRANSHFNFKMISCPRHRILCEKLQTF
jgi:hypothetical protein